MIRKILILLFLLLVIVYLAVAITAFNRRPAGQVCEGVELIIKDSVDYGFVRQRDILRLLDGKKISPAGKPMDEIDISQIEAELSRHSLIENVECFRTASGKIGIEITQRLPILRVMPDKGKDYYIDSKGEIMPLPGGGAAHVAVATGNVDTTFAKKELYEFGMFLQHHPLWKAQVEQINVTADKEIEVVPRVGGHILFLGKPGDYEAKFDRLKLFYKKGLGEVGWNKYSRISLEFSNQIICTKKEK